MGAPPTCSWLCRSVGCLETPLAGGIQSGGNLVGLQPFTCGVWANSKSHCENGLEGQNTQLMQRIGWCQKQQTGANLLQFRTSGSLQRCSLELIGFETN